MGFAGCVGWQGQSRTATAQPLRIIQIRMKNDYQIDGIGFSLNAKSGKTQQVPKKSGEWEEGGRVERRGIAGSAGGVRAEAPLALRYPVEHVIHGDRRVDHYAWMREKSDPRVREYLEAENAYTEGMLRPMEGRKGTLYQ